MKVKTIDEMVAELKGMTLALDNMSNEEIRDLNIALNVGIATNDVNVIRSLYTMIKVVQSSVADVARLNTARYHASEALLREGLFTPQNVYQMKEDLEAVSQLHSRHKKETTRLVEEGAIAITRNAELKIENMELKHQLASQ